MALRRGIAAALVFPFLAGGAAAADLPGWDRTRWGLSSAEIASLYDGRAIKLDGRVEFYHLYADVALRRAPLAGHDFIVYFQMDEKTHRLTQVLLERLKQYATAQVWRDVVAALERDFGPPTASCDKPGKPLDGAPGVLERVWTMPTTSLRASFIAFGATSPDLTPQDDGGFTRRLLIRYAPTGKAEPVCP